MSSPSMEQQQQLSTTSSSSSLFATRPYFKLEEVQRGANSPNHKHTHTHSTLYSTHTNVAGLVTHTRAYCTWTGRYSPKQHTIVLVDVSMCVYCNIYINTRLSECEILKGGKSDSLLSRRECFECMNERDNLCLMFSVVHSSALEFAHRLIVILFIVD